MSNEILFNSPALHALKRAQLVKLCRRYGIKVTGKNAELVDKLQQHAATLPPTTTVILPSESGIEDDVTEDDDDGQDNDDYMGNRQRASQQWELVEGDTQETFGQSSVTLQVDFGERFATTKASSSIGSSMRAFASSFKRSQVGNPALMEVDISKGTTLVPEETLAQATNTSAATLKPSTPQHPDPNVPSTIRLVTSSQVTEQPCDLPMLPSLSATFPPLPEGLASASPSSSSLYPRLPSEPRADTEETDPDMPGGFTPKRSRNLPAFTFGSPAHGVSNDQFATAATSVLDELNRRVAAAGGKVLENPTSRLSFTNNANLASPRKLSRFETVHDKHFSKMDSIANHYAAKRSTPTAAQVPDSSTRAAKRKIEDEPQPSSASVVPPGQEPVPSAKRARTSLYPQPRKTHYEEPNKGPEMVLVRDSLAQKRRLDQAKKRRSSTGRRGSTAHQVHSGGRTVSGSSTASKSGATSRFGFLKSSAKLVQRVFSGTSKQPQQTNLPRMVSATKGAPETNGPSAKSQPTPGPRSILLSGAPSNSLSASQGSSSKPPAAVLPKSVAYKQLSAIGSAQSAPTSRAPSARATSNATARSASSHRITSVPSRKPLPSFDVAKSQSPLVDQHDSAVKIRTTSSSSATKENTAIQRSTQGENVVVKRASTLYAPTASSLARMQATLRPPSMLSVVPEHTSLTKSPGANITSVINTTRSPISSPRPMQTPFTPLGVITNVITDVDTNLKSSPSKAVAKRRPRISRGVVISKLNERRAAGAGLGVLPGKSRSSLAAKAYARRSLGVKATLGVSGQSTALEMQRAFRARQSEIARRKSRARASVVAK